MDSRESREKVALFPASFDPLTNGHLDVVERALGIFDRVVVAVAFNIEKKDTFTKDERLAMLRSVFGDEPRVDVTAFDTLTVDFAMEIGAKVIIRGLRAMSDFEYEFEMALMNKHLYPEVETVFMMASQKYLYVSSSRLKELVRLGRSVDAFVPAIVAKKLHEKLGRAASG
jgi:pantetheine-phosphate adenylyltransferase